MTISTQSNRVDFTGNGSATVFPYSFKAFSASDLRVIRTDSTTGVDTVLTSPGDYTATFGPSGGNVTLTSALAGPPAAQRLSIIRVVPTTQTTVVTNQGPFPASTIEERFDRLTAMVQQIDERSKRAFRLGEADIVPATGLPSVDPVLQSKAFLGSGDRALFFNASGLNYSSELTVQDIEAIAGQLVDIGLVAGSIGDVNTVAGSISDVQAAAAFLAVASPAILAKNNAGDLVARTLSAGAGLSWTNADGGAGDPLISFDTAGDAALIAIGGGAAGRSVFKLGAPSTASYMILNPNGSAVYQPTAGAGLGDAVQAGNNVFTGENTIDTDAGGDLICPVDIPAALQPLIPNPPSIRDRTAPWSLLDFGNARTEMAKDVSIRNMSDAFQKAMSSGEVIEVPPGDYPVQPDQDWGGQPSVVFVQGSIPVDVRMAKGARVIIPADFGGGSWDPTTQANVFLYRPTGQATPENIYNRFKFEGGMIDARPYTAFHGAVPDENYTGLDLFRVFRAWQPEIKGVFMHGGITTPSVNNGGWGAVDTGISTHQCYGDQIEGNTFIGMFDLGYYPNGNVINATLTDPFTTTNGSPVVSVAYTAHGLEAGDRVFFGGASAVGGIAGAALNREFAVVSVTNANAFTINAGTNASSDATGGGTVEANPLSRSQYLGFDWATSAGEDFTFRKNVAWKCFQVVSPKRSWRGYTVDDNRAHECGHFLREQQGGNLQTQGVIGRIVGNRATRTQDGVIILTGGSGYQVSQNYIADFGRRISNETIPGGRSGILLNSVADAVVSENIIKQIKWGAPPPGDNFSTGISLVQQAGRIDGCVDCDIINNNIDNVWRGTLERDGRNNRFNNTIKNTGIPNSHSNSSVRPPAGGDTHPRGMGVNPAFQVWSLSTSDSSYPPGGTYIADMWKLDRGGSGGGLNITISRQSHPVDSPEAKLSQYFARITVTTLGGSTRQGLRAVFPRLSRFINKGRFTAVCLVRLNRAGTISFIHSASSGSGGSLTLNSALSTPQTLTADITADVWTPVYVPINLVATSFTEGAGSYLEMVMRNGSPATDDVFDVAFCDIYEGDICTPPNTRPLADVAKEVNRYLRRQDFFVPASQATLGVIDMDRVPTITGGGAGFDSAGTTAQTLIALQTTGAVETLTLDAQP